MHELTFETERQTQLLDITEDVRKQIAGAASTLVTIFVPHTTAGVILQAGGNGAGGVPFDVEVALERLIDESWSWSHSGEGTDNPASHVRAALTPTSVAIPIKDGDLLLGDFQRIFLSEFDGPRRRQVLLTIT